MSATAALLNDPSSILACDGLALFTADPELDGSNVAGGGEVQAVTMGALGVEGPNPTRHPATDGRTYSTEQTFDLAEAATHWGLFDGATFVVGFPLRTPIGPGSIPFVGAVQFRSGF